MPSKMGRKCSEVLWLESNDDWLWEGCLNRKGWGLASIVRSVSEFLTHETVRVMSIEWSLSDLFVHLKLACPREFGPTHSSNCRMNVSRFHGIEISPVIEQVPFYCSDDVAFSALGVELGKLPPRIADENTSKTFLHVL